MRRLPIEPTSDPLWFISDGGETGALARSIDWSRSALGPPESWPQALFHSRHPMFLWWGPELIQFYNDAYRPSFGRGKHPAAMGQRGEDCWPEIWSIITETTQEVRARLEVERARKEADLAREELQGIFMQAPLPMCILTGPEHVFTLANAPYVQLVGREVLGLPVRQAFSEVEVERRLFNSPARMA